MAASPSVPRPAPAAAWYTVVLLTAAYVFSFIDRYILGLLVEPIKADMALTDTQIGLLLGPAFAQCRLVRDRHVDAVQPDAALVGPIK